MTEDTADATELKLKEISPERLVMEPEDAIHSFEFRLNDQRAKKGKYSPGAPVPPIIDINIKNYESAIRLVDDILQRQPEATLPDVASELSRQLQQSNSPTNIKRLEIAVREINSLLIDFRGDIRRLTTQEREYVLARRKPKETDTASEQKVIQEALQKGIFRANFSAVLVNKETGRPEWSGFREFYSKEMTRDHWGGFNQQNPLMLIIPEGHDGERLPDELKRFLSENNVADAVAVRAEYQRKTKKMTTQKTVSTPGLFGREQVITTEQTEFDRNEPILFCGTKEPAVRICYQTMTNNNYKERAMYTDEFGRPGNGFSLEMIVPLSVAEKISRLGKENPRFFRDLAKSAVFDNQAGIVAGFKEIAFADNTGDRKNDPHLKNDRSLPPYDDEDWRKAKTIVSIDLTVPTADKQTDYTQQNRIKSIDTAKQQLLGLIVSPKNN